MTEWTPCADRLPDDDTLVIMALDDGEVWPGFLDGGTWRDDGAVPLEAGRVTHWMPMPPHPTQAERTA